MNLDYYTVELTDDKKFATVTGYRADGSTFAPAPWAAFAALNHKLPNVKECCICDHDDNSMTIAII